ncbi:MAG: hypothetical protein K0S55_2017 [Clostridia bacterium]|nr:hypothetical protein [Clostridia bacterium]
MSTNLSKNQLKILVLFTLKSAGSPLSLSSLGDILGFCDINYFHIQECIVEHISMKHIIIHVDEGNEFAMLSPKGEQIVEALKNDVPVSIRERVASATALEIARIRHNLSIDVEVVQNNEPDDGSYTLNLALRDDALVLLKLSMYTPTKLQADMMAKNFNDNPTKIYKTILNAIIKKIPESDEI